MKNRSLIIGIITSVILIACSAPKKKEYKADCISTTQTNAWFKQDVSIADANIGEEVIRVFTDSALQKMDGFGACFNELGWESLSYLDETQRDSIFKEMFLPGFGASFNLCRMPVGANDFSRDWYSYDEVKDDLLLTHFSIDNDKETLIPFIKSARVFNPELKLWASPWGPPKWMKRNNHYAMSKVPSVIENIDNGMKDSQVGKEGEDMFILKDEYLKAYAQYFSKFILSYQKEGIPISMVMPQNEFNSAQWYPSCTWTPEGLQQFVSYLGPEMAKLDVKVFFGTLERGKPGIFDAFYSDPAIRQYVSGIGLQWAGKEAAESLHKKYPTLTIYQTEHECGDSENTWAYMEYGWDLMKHYVLNGANAYMYWNTSLLSNGISRWGWKQNSLVSVDSLNHTYTYNYDYYLMKHVSHFVHPGAVLLQTSSKKTVNNRDDVLGWWKGDLTSNADNLLAFQNPDFSVVIVVYNSKPEKECKSIEINGKVLSFCMEPKSLNTITFR